MPRWVSDMQRTPWIPVLIGPIAIAIAIASQVPNLGERLACVTCLDDLIALVASK